jgi:hypothetical protein
VMQWARQRRQLLQLPRFSSVTQAAILTYPVRIAPKNALETHVWPYTSLGTTPRL